jgi:hypothetical protein
MREFFVITLDAQRDDLTTVVDYNLNDVDITDFWHAKKLDEKLPEKMELFVDDLNTDETDVMGNPLSLLIFSKRLLNILMPIIKEDIQIFNAPLINNKDREKIKNFYIIHPFKEFKCIDLEKTRHKYITAKHVLMPFNPLYIINKQVPLDINFFRTKEHNNSRIVTNSILDLLNGKKINGIAFLKCESV